MGCGVTFADIHGIILATTSVKNARAVASGVFLGERKEVRILSRIRK